MCECVSASCAFCCVYYFTSAEEVLGCGIVWVHFNGVLPVLANAVGVGNGLLGGQVVAQPIQDGTTPACAHLWLATTHEPGEACWVQGNTACNTLLATHSVLLYQR